MQCEVDRKAGIGRECENKKEQQDERGRVDGGLIPGTQVVGC